MAHNDFDFRICSPDRLAPVRPASLVCSVSNRAVICPDCSAIEPVDADARISSLVAVPAHMHRADAKAF